MLSTLAAIAAVGLLIEAIIVMLVVGAIFFGGWKGLGFANGQARRGVGIVHRVLSRVEGLAARSGRLAVEPLIRVYGTYAWVRGFAHGVRRAWRM